MNTSVATENADALREAYAEIAYETGPYRKSHPDRMATIATLLGFSAPRVESCRVLELACSDGLNIIPMAATFPNATFVGIDFTESAIARGRGIAQALGVRNLNLMAGDIRNLPDDLGTFDYVIAHGLYSWVPDDVRKRALPSIARHLSREGFAFVSYNTYPGCYVRRMLWEMMKYHTRHLATGKEKLAAARELLAVLAEPATTQSDVDEPLRREAEVAMKRTDSALYHDDMGEPNNPFYFHEFVADAHANGLEFVAEAELHTMIAGGITPRVREYLRPMERLAREQYLDFVHFRRFRQSLLHHADASSQYKLQPANVRSMHVRASRESLDIAANDPNAQVALPDPTARLVNELALSRWPQTFPVMEIIDRMSGQPSASPIAPEFVVAQLYAGGLIDLHVAPPPVAAAATDRPQVFAPARWQVKFGDTVTNVYHESILVNTPGLPVVMPLLDGTRTRAQVIADAGAALPAESAEAMLEYGLVALARSALLVA